jgi:hypothetical protein
MFAAHWSRAPATNPTTTPIEERKFHEEIMLRSICRLTLSIACGLALWACADSSRAHFLWIKTITHEGRPHAFLFFGENALDEAYHLPEALADSKLWRRTANGKRTQLPAKALETDERIGLISPMEFDTPCVLEATEQYGIYGTALLVYSAKHVHAGSIDEFNAADSSKELALHIVPRVNEKQLELTVFWQGKPLRDAEVSVSVDDAEAVKNKTDESGRVTLEPEGDGVVSVLANRLDKELKGELNDKKYDHGLHYTSVTFEWPLAVVRGSPGPAPLQSRETSEASLRSALPPLPEPVSSFGAVVAGGWLYVYGGHIGTEHEHSAANLSNHFRRLRLSDAAQWEELPMQTRLQGLALVAHHGKIYRIGGMNARNATIDDEEDLHSSAEFAEFDPSTGQWTALAPLPAPRSSHNAVVIGDRLYVVGGWALAGSSPGEWQQDALVYDFSDPPLGRIFRSEAQTQREFGAERRAGWQKLPEPPFKRRALAASHWDGKVVAIGGLDDEGEVSQRVDVFDPETGDWREGPTLPGDGHSGFGVSAWNLDGQLYVSGIRGVLLQLSDDGSKWQEVARLEKPRFFHQLVPAPDGGLLAVGGASRDGHLVDIEWITVRK